MAAVAPPSIVINDPSTTSSPQPASKPAPPTLNTTSTSQSANSQSLLDRRNSLTTTSPSSAVCYLCDEQNPGDFSATTKHLDSCVLCSRYFCPIHHSPQHPHTAICNINHATYYHDMLVLARDLLSKQSPTSPDDAEAPTPLGGRGIAELLIQEGIYPSLGEREKAIFATSPVDDQKIRELGAWRSLDAAVANDGVRGVKGTVEEREVVGADIAV